MKYKTKCKINRPIAFLLSITMFFTSINFLASPLVHADDVEEKTLELKDVLWTGDEENQFTEIPIPESTYNYITLTDFQTQYGTGDNFNQPEDSDITIEIDTAEEFLKFAQAANSSNTAEKNYYLSANYVLGNNIECKSVGSIPMIGSSTNPFKGKIDGQNFEIRELKIDNDGTQNTDYFAIFPVLGADAEITNLGIVYPYIDKGTVAKGNVAVVAAENNGTIQNVYVDLVSEDSAVISENASISGFVTINNGTIDNVYFAGRIIKDKSGNGGLVVGAGAEISGSLTKYSPICITNNGSITNAFYDCTLFPADEIKGSNYTAAAPLTTGELQSLTGMTATDSNGNPIWRSHQNDISNSENTEYNSSIGTWGNYPKLYGFFTKDAEGNVTAITDTSTIFYITSVADLIYFPISTQYYKTNNTTKNEFIIKNDIDMLAAQENAYKPSDFEFSYATLKGDKGNGESINIYNLTMDIPAKITNGNGTMYSLALIAAPYSSNSQKAISIENINIVGGHIEPNSTFDIYSGFNAHSDSGAFISTLIGGGKSTAYINFKNIYNSAEVCGGNTKITNIHVAGVAAMSKSNVNFSNVVNFGTISGGVHEYNERNANVDENYRSSVSGVATYMGAGTGTQTNVANYGTVQGVGLYGNYTEATSANIANCSQDQDYSYFKKPSTALKAAKMKVTGVFAGTTGSTSIVGKNIANYGNIYDVPVTVDEGGNVSAIGLEGYKCLNLYTYVCGVSYSGISGSSESQGIFNSGRIMNVATRLTHISGIAGGYVKYGRNRGVLTTENGMYSISGINIAYGVDNSLNESDINIIFKNFDIYSSHPGSGNAAMLCISGIGILGTAKKCENYGNLSIDMNSLENDEYTSKLSMMIAIQGICKITNNCINHGDITVSAENRPISKSTSRFSLAIGGLGAYQQSNSFTGSVNYGDIKVTDNSTARTFAGGGEGYHYYRSVSVIGGGYRGNTTKCENYGDIVVENTVGTEICGVAFSNNNGSASNNINYGNITAVKCSSVIINGITNTNTNFSSNGVDSNINYGKLTAENCSTVSVYGIGGCSKYSENNNINFGDITVKSCSNTITVCGIAYGFYQKSNTNHGNFILEDNTSSAIYIYGIAVGIVNYVYNNDLNTGNINLSNNTFSDKLYITGGIGNGTVTNCVNLGNVSVDNISNGNIINVSGITINGHNVKNCVNKGNVSIDNVVVGSTFRVAGIAIKPDVSGQMVEDCANLGDINITTSQSSNPTVEIGGVIANSGDEDTTDATLSYIRNCGNYGDISANIGSKNTYIGGIVGKALFQKSIPTTQKTTNNGKNTRYCWIENNINMGNINSDISATETVSVGGIIGYLSATCSYQAYVTVTNNVNHGTINSTANVSALASGGIIGRQKEPKYNYNTGTDSQTGEKITYNPDIEIQLNLYNVLNYGNILESNNSVKESNGIIGLKEDGLTIVDEERLFNVSYDDKDFHSENGKLFDQTVTHIIADRTVENCIKLTQHEALSERFKGLFEEDLTDTTNSKYNGAGYVLLAYNDNGTVRSDTPEPLNIAKNFETMGNYGYNYTGKTIPEGASTGNWNQITINGTTAYDDIVNGKASQVAIPEGKSVVSVIMTDTKTCNNVSLGNIVNEDEHIVDVYLPIEAFCGQEVQISEIELSVLAKGMYSYTEDGDFNIEAKDIKLTLPADGSSTSFYVAVSQVLDTEPVIWEIRLNTISMKEHIVVKSISIATDASDSFKSNNTYLTHGSYTGMANIDSYSKLNFEYTDFPLDENVTYSNGEITITNPDDTLITYDEEENRWVLSDELTSWFFVRNTNIDSSLYQLKIEVETYNLPEGYNFTDNKRVNLITNEGEASIDIGTDVKMENRTASYSRDLVLSNTTFDEENLCRKGKITLYINDYNNKGGDVTLSFEHANTPLEGYEYDIEEINFQRGKNPFAYIYSIGDSSILTGTSYTHPTEDNKGEITSTLTKFFTPSSTIIKSADDGGSRFGPTYSISSWSKVQDYIKLTKINIETGNYNKYIPEQFIFNVSLTSEDGQTENTYDIKINNVQGDVEIQSIYMNDDLQEDNSMTTISRNYHGKSVFHVTYSNAYINNPMSVDKIASPTEENNEQFVVEYKKYETDTSYTILSYDEYSQYINISVDANSGNFRYEVDDSAPGGYYKITPIYIFSTTVGKDVELATEATLRVTEGSEEITWRMPYQSMNICKELSNACYMETFKISSLDGAEDTVSDMAPFIGIPNSNNDDFDDLEGGNTYIKYSTGEIGYGNLNVNPEDDTNREKSLLILGYIKKNSGQNECKLDITIPNNATLWIKDDDTGDYREVTSDDLIVDISGDELTTITKQFKVIAEDLEHETEYTVILDPAERNKTFISSKITLHGEGGSPQNPDEDTILQEVIAKQGSVGVTIKRMRDESHILEYQSWIYNENEQNPYLTQMYTGTYIIDVALPAGYTYKITYYNSDELQDSESINSVGKELVLGLKQEQNIELDIIIVRTTVPWGHHSQVS